jgi:hypothetical protein
MNTAFVIPVQDVIVPRNDPAVGSRLNLMEGSIVLEQETLTKPNFGSGSLV